MRQHTEGIKNIIKESTGEGIKKKKAKHYPTSSCTQSEIHIFSNIRTVMQ
jgi:hypothetical protein